MLSLTECVWDFQNNKLCDTHNLLAHHYQIGRLVAISLHKFNDHKFVVLYAHMHTMISLLFYLYTGSSTPRGGKAAVGGTQSITSVSAMTVGYQQLMSKSSDYPPPAASAAGSAVGSSAAAAGLTGSQGQLSNRQTSGGGNTALSPRVNHKQR